MATLEGPIAARAALARGRQDEAVKLLDRWLMTHPTDTEAVRMRVQVALDQHRSGEVLNLLYAWTARAPSDANAWRMRAIAELEANDVSAVESWRQVLALKPDDVAVRLDLSAALILAGFPNEAEQEIRKVLAQRPQWGVGYARLGEALLAQGNLVAAEKAFRSALAFDKTDTRTPLVLAKTLRDLGRPAEAATVLQGRHDSEALLARANAQLESGDADGAIKGWTAALTVRPGWFEPSHNLGMELARRGDPEGLRLLAAAVLSTNAPDYAAVSFAEAVAMVPDLPVKDAAFRDAVSRVLVADGVDPSPLDRAVRAILGDILDGSGDRVPDILVPWLERTLVRSWRAEQFLIRLRDSLVDRTQTGHTVPVALAVALATQAFYSDYAWGGVSPALPNDAAGVALRATFAPLSSLSAAELAKVPRLAAIEARRSRELARGAAAPSLGRRSDDATSAAVRAMYEENPYPTLVYLSRKPKLTLPAAIRGLFPRTKAPLPPVSPDILIAGCGTGQQALAATRYQNARITAVDLSRRSLGIAAERAIAAGEAIRFAQADILGLGEVAEEFDLVECGGVLHHLADPLLGWRVLMGLLRPGGWMKVALYSELGRPAVIAAREWLSEQGFSAASVTVDELRDARRQLAALPDTHPAKAVVSSPDFYSLSGFRDLVFHVQEHRFTLPQLRDALAALGLRFVGFQHARPEPARWYRAMWPDDANLDDLDRWEAVERAHPETFAGMYQFWCVYW